MQSLRAVLRKIFFSSEEPARLRLGWRLLFHTLLFFILAIGFSILSFLAIRLVPALTRWNMDLLIETAAVTLATWLACRWWCRRSLVSLGLQWTQRSGRDFLAGVAIAAALQTFIVVVLSLLGMAKVFFPAKITAESLLQALGPALLMWALVAWNEELWMRGYWLQNIAENYGVVWGVVLSSVMFAALHLLNPHISWRAEVGLVLAGLFLGYGYARTRQLWLPMGLHFGWNFFEGTVYGFSVSGLTVQTVLRTVVSGPEWLTGGLFGPEAGLIVVPALALGAVLIARYTARGKGALDEVAT
ncbi:MAG: CPBP family intramembrane metalloprotease [Chloroflexi bacterium]|nr:CPBP family intramembrane metalloprotease [Chloroflexota bacterium]